FPARQHLRQDPRLDLGPCRARNRRRADGVAHQAGTDATRAGACKFLACHDLHELVGRHAAELFRETETEQADRGRLFVKRAWKLAGLVPLMRVRLDLLLDKTAHHLAKGFMLGGVERAGHARSVLVKAFARWRQRHGLTCVEWLARPRYSVPRHASFSTQD